MIMTDKITENIIGTPIEVHKVIKGQRRMTRKSNFVYTLI